MIPIGTSITLRDVSAAVIGLIFANTVMFLVQTGLPADLAKQFILHNALVPARYFDPGFAPAHGLRPYDFWPLFTNQFMHSGWLHLIVNMWTLWVIGRPLEQRIGALRFILFYLICGLVADVAHIASNPGSQVPALGASGAIAGILGGYAVLYPASRVRLIMPVLLFPIVYYLPALVYAVIWFAIQIAEGLADQALAAGKGGIAWWAHVGGFVAGVILVKVVGSGARRVREIDIVAAALDDSRAVAQAGGLMIGERYRRKRIVGGTQRPRKSRKPVARRTSGSKPERRTIKSKPTRRLQWKDAAAAFEKFKKDASLGSGTGASDDTLSGALIDMMSGTEPSDEAFDLTQPVPRRRVRSMIPSSGSRSRRSGEAASVKSAGGTSGAWDRSGG